MNINNVTGIILTAVVVVLLVGVVVLPTIDLSNDTQYEDKDNTGYDYKMARTTGSSYSLSIAANTEAGQGHYTIDGQSVTLTGSDSRLYLFDNGGIYITATDNWIWTANTNQSCTKFNFTGAPGSGGLVNSIVFASGTATTTMSTDATRTSEYTWVIHPDASGTLGFFRSAGYSVNSGENFYAFFASGTDATGKYAALGLGSGQSMTKLIGTSGSTTFSVDSVLVGHAYEVSGVSISYAGSSVATTGYIAPLTYEGIVDQEATPLQMIVSVIPIVLIVSVIIMAIGYTVRRD